MIDNSLDNLIAEKVEDGYAIVGVKDRLLHMPKLVIPNYINHIYGEAFRGCFSGCQELEKVVINEGITNISKSAFSNCYKLSKVVFPKSLKVINEYAFYNCDNLKMWLLTKIVL